MKLIFWALLLVSFPVQAAILDIQTVTSPKGITAWLVEDHSVPVVSLRFMFKGAGSANDPADKQGLSQILSNTLDEGAGDLDSKAFQEKLNDNSISLGFSTSRDDFGGHLKTLVKYQDTAFDLLTLAVTKPRFDADPVSRMINSNLVRIRSNMTDPEWMNARLTNAVIFKDHPYAMNSGGTLSSLPKITADDLRQKFKTQFGKDRLIVSVAGDITKEKLSAVLDQVFGDLPSTSTVKEIEQAKLSSGPETVLYQLDIPQTVINMVMPGIKRDDPDYHIAEIMDFTLGSSGFGSRLTEEIREKRGLTYGIYSNLGEMDHAAQISIGVATKNETAQQVVDLTRDVMKGLTEEVITEKEIKDAKSYLLGSVPLQLTSTDRITAVMMNLQSDKLPADYLDRRETEIGGATPKDVLRVAKNLLSPQNMKIILVGQPKMRDTVQTVSSLPNVE